MRALFVDQNDEDELTSAFAQNPALLLIETPSNPILRITDIKKLTTLAKNCGVISVVDNTFLSPALQQPLDLGADIVVHSTTKYLNGHSDVVGGAAIAKTQELADQLSWWANCLGITGAPFDSYQTLRGIRTLDVRIKHQCRSAQIVAEFLDNHPAISKVYYPGLKTHPGHELAKTQQSGFGAMLSFELDGDFEQLDQFARSLELFSLAESLGGVESLIAHPASMTHAAMEAEARKVAGISDNLFRVSVGLEDAEDLISDLSSALLAISQQIDLIKTA